MVLLYQAELPGRHTRRGTVHQSSDCFFLDTPKNPDHVLPDRIYGTMQRLA